MTLNRLVTYEMSTSQVPYVYRIDRRAGQKGSRPSVRDQAEVKNLLLSVIVCRCPPKHMVPEMVEWK